MARRLPRAREAVRAALELSSVPRGVDSAAASIRSAPDVSFRHPPPLQRVADPRQELAALTFSIDQWKLRWRSMRSRPAGRCYEQ